MLAYRITAESFAADLSGEGARRFGGRWNPEGIPVLYTSESVALAALEVLVNVPPEYLGEGMFSLVSLAIPDDTPNQILEPATLPVDWSSYPAPAVLAELGRQWVETGNSLVLKVPSVVVGGNSWNYLLNPRHPDYRLIRLVQITPFVFDVRLRGS
jgi:RES domain-containing protein